MPEENASYMAPVVIADGRKAGQKPLEQPSSPSLKDDEEQA